MHWAWPAPASCRCAVAHSTSVSKLPRWPHWARGAGGLVTSREGEAIGSGEAPPARSLGGGASKYQPLCAAPVESSDGRRGSEAAMHRVPSARARRRLLSKRLTAVTQFVRISSHARALSYGRLGRHACSGAASSTVRVLRVTGGVSMYQFPALAGADVA